MHGRSYSAIDKKLKAHFSEDEMINLLKKDKEVFDVEYFYRNGLYNQTKEQTRKGYVELDEIVTSHEGFSKSN